MVLLLYLKETYSGSFEHFISHSWILLTSHNLLLTVVPIYLIRGPEAPDFILGLKQAVVAQTQAKFL